MKISVGGDVGASGSDRIKSNDSFRLNLLCFVYSFVQKHTFTVLRAESVHDLDVVHSYVPCAASVCYTFHHHLNHTQAFLSCQIFLETLNLVTEHRCHPGLT